MKLVHASLFSGIGGSEVAASILGWRNAFHCEINPFGRRILDYHFPESESYGDITKTDFTRWRGKIDVLTGGFPCQPFSLAGRRNGADDDRYLWPEFIRVIHEIKPSWVVGENVAGILTMVQPGKAVDVGRTSSLFGEGYTDKELRQQYVTETICRDLEREGYSVQPFLIPACAVGAPHRRDRVWFVAKRIIADPADTRPESLQCGRKDRVHAAGVASHPDEHRNTTRTAGEGIETIQEDEFPFQGERTVGSKRSDGLHGLPRDATDTDSDELQGKCISRKDEAERWKDENGRFEEYSGNDWTTLPADRWHDFPTQSPVCSRNDGFPIPMDGITFSKWRQESIKAYGNAWVSQVAYEIFRAIEITERDMNNE